MSETSQQPFHNPSSTCSDSLNWDECTTYRRVNGVTVHEQREPDSKEATYMVSASVHATPEDCLKVRSPKHCNSMSVPLHALPALTTIKVIGIKVGVYFPWHA